MKKFFDLRENKLSEAVYDVSWGRGAETQVVATDANDAIKKGKAVILKRIPKLADPKYSDTWQKRPNVHKIRESSEPEAETLSEDGYKADAEKSKFKSGWRAKLLNPQGKVSYLSQHTFKSKPDAVAYAKQYHNHVNVQNRNPDRVPAPDKSKLVETFIVEDAWEEIPMMQRQLKFIAYAAEEIMEYLEFGVDPEEWYQNKLAQVHMQMQTLYAYMEGEDKDVEYDDEDMEEMRDPAHPYLHGGKHSKNLSTMGWPTKDVKIQQGSGKHYINVHQYKESLDEADQAKRLMSPLQKIRMDKEKADRDRKKGKDPAHKRLNGPGGIYKNLVKRFGEDTEIEIPSEITEKLKVSDGVGAWDEVERTVEQSMNEEVKLDEAKLSQSQRDRLDDLILNVHMTTHPEYDGDEEPTKYLNMIRKEFGDKVAKQVDDGMDKVHWGRDNHTYGSDKLSWRKGNARITKSGKMNAQDVNALKNRIKRDKAWGGITKKVKLPEAVELDELSAVTLGKYSQKARTDALDHSGGPWGKKKDPARVAKRLSGDAMAVKKLDKIRKEEVDLDEAPNQNWADKEISHSREQERLAKQKEKTMKAKNAASRQFQKSSEIHAKTAKADHDVMKARRGQKIEEVELDEAKTDIYHKHMLKALGKSRLPKGHQYTSAIATNGDFVVKDGGGRVAGRIPKKEHNLNEVSDKKLDAYRQKAFADQPSGDDGSNKYRKRKFGRDLAFAKQTGRAKVLATKEEVELDQETQYEIVESYLLENNIDVNSLTEEELNELIGKAIGGAFKLGAKAVVGASRLAKKAVINKQGNIRGTQAARQDAAGNRAEKEAKRREAEYNRRKRIQDAEKRARDLDDKIRKMKN